MKLCSRMNTQYAHKHIMFSPAQLLCNWHEQWPNNQGDLDSSVTGEILLHSKGPASNLISLP
jgi:hypothetical protein